MEKTKKHVKSSDRPNEMFSDQKKLLANLKKKLKKTVQKGKQSKECDNAKKSNTNISDNMNVITSPESKKPIKSKATVRVKFDSKFPNSNIITSNGDIKHKISKKLSIRSDANDTKVQNETKMRTNVKGTNVLQNEKIVTKDESIKKNKNKKKKQKKKPMQVEQSHSENLKTVNNTKRNIDEVHKTNKTCGKKRFKTVNGFVETNANDEEETKLVRDKLKNESKKTVKIEQTQDDNGPAVKIHNVDLNQVNEFGSNSDSEADSYIDKFFNDNDDFDENHINSLEEIKASNENGFLLKSSEESIPSDDSSSSECNSQLDNLSEISISNSDNSIQNSPMNKLINYKNDAKKKDFDFNDCSWTNGNQEISNNINDMYYGTDSSVSLGSEIDSDELDESYECESTDVESDIMNEYEDDISYDEYEENSSDYESDSETENDSYSESASSQDTYDDFLHRRHSDDEISSNSDHEYTDSRYDDLRIAPGTAITYKITDERIKIFENDTQSRIVELPITDSDNDSCVNLIPINVSRAKYLQSEHHRKMAEKTKKMEEESEVETKRLKYEKSVADYYNMDNSVDKTAGPSTESIDKSVSIVECPKNFNHSRLNWMDDEEKSGQSGIDNDTVYPKSNGEKVVVITTDVAKSNIQSNDQQQNMAEKCEESSNSSCDEDFENKPITELEKQSFEDDSLTQTQFITLHDFTRDKEKEMRNIGKVKVRTLEEDDDFNDEPEDKSESEDEPCETIDHYITLDAFDPDGRRVATNTNITNVKVRTLEEDEDIDESLIDELEKRSFEEAIPNGHDHFITLDDFTPKERKQPNARIRPLEEDEDFDFEEEPPVDLENRSFEPHPLSIDHFITLDAAETFTDETTEIGFVMSEEEKKKKKKTRNIRKIRKIRELEMSDDDSDDESSHAIAVTDTLENDDDESDQTSRKNEPMFFNALNSRHVLLLLRKKLYFHGSLRVKLIAGNAIAFGYELEINKPIKVYSPRGHGLISLIPKTASPDKDILQKLDDLKVDFYTQDIDQVQDAFKNGSHAILLLERDQTNKGVNMIDRYMRETVFPNINAFDSENPFYSSEFVLHCKFLLHPPNGLVYHEDWSSIELHNKSKVVAIGGKGVGKSTFVRYLINSNLKKFNQFVLVDLDIGQAELFVPQTLSATVVTEPILGPGYLQNLKPAKAILFGDINVLPNPVKYLRCVRQIFEFCSSQSEFANMPWIINTMGYSRGFGSEIMACILKIFKPTELVQIQSQQSNENFDQIMDENVVNKFKFNMFEDDMNQIDGICKHKTFVFQSVRGKKNQKNDMNAVDLRYATIFSKLGNCLKSNTDWLTSVKPFEVSLNDLDVLVTSGEKVNPSDYLDLLNGNLVYLCQKQDNNNLNDIVDCHGIGIVRSVDAETNKLYLLSTIPLNELQNVNVLSIGVIPLPSAVFLNQHLQIRGAVPYVYNSNNFVGSKQVVQHIFRAERRSNNNQIQLMEY